VEEPHVQSFSRVEENKIVSFKHRVVQDGSGLFWLQWLSPIHGWITEWSTSYETRSLALDNLNKIMARQTLTVVWEEEEDA